MDICGILYNSDSQEDATKIIDIVDSIFAEVSPTERGRGVTIQKILIHHTNKKTRLRIYKIYFKNALHAMRKLRNEEMKTKEIFVALTNIIKTMDKL